MAKGRVWTRVPLELPAALGSPLEPVRGASDREAALLRAERPRLPFTYERLAWHFVRKNKVLLIFFQGNGILPAKEAAATRAARGATHLPTLAHWRPGRFQLLSVPGALLCHAPWLLDLLFCQKVIGAVPRLSPSQALPGEQRGWKERGHGLFQVRVPVCAGLSRERPARAQDLTTCRGREGGREAAAHSLRTQHGPGSQDPNLRERGWGGSPAYVGTGLSCCRHCHLQLCHRR